jgi:hypothetical protein
MQNIHLDIDANLKCFRANSEKNQTLLSSTTSIHLPTLPLKLKHYKDNSTVQTGEISCMT